MIKPIGLTGARADKVAVITGICFTDVSATELKLLKTLLEFGTNNSITITPDLARQIMDVTGMKQSSFNMSFHRLYKKGIMSSMGKTKVFHPVYNNILDCDKILISFSPENIQV